LVVQMFGRRRTLAQRPPLIPAQAAVAKTPSISPSPTVAFTPTPFVTPTPQLVKTPPIVSSSYLEASVVKRPLVDIFVLEKKLSLGLIMLLLLVLTVDGIFVLKRKTVRIVGLNIAHIIFLGTLIGLIFLTKRGVIL